MGSTGATRIIAGGRRARDSTGFCLRVEVDDDSLGLVVAAASALPDDVDALKALRAAALQRADEAEARVAHAVARETAIEALIAHFKLQIAKLRRERYGASAERMRRLLDQLELQVEELEADASYSLSCLD